MLSLNVQNTVTTLTSHYSHHHTFYNNYIKTSQGEKSKNANKKRMNDYMYAFKENYSTKVSHIKKIKNKTNQRNRDNKHILLVSLFLLCFNSYY